MEFSEIFPQAGFSLSESVSESLFTQSVKALINN